MPFDALCRTLLCTSVNLLSAVEKGEEFIFTYETGKHLGL